jgi:hypothetical protein
MPNGCFFLECGKRASPAGGYIMRHVLHCLALIRLAPKGAMQAHKVLEIAPEGLVKGGEKEIFTSLLFFLARKI